MVLVVSVCTVSSPAAAASDTSISGSLRLETVVELPEGVFAFQAIRGDFVVLANPPARVERMNYKTGERIPLVGPPGSWVTAVDMSDEGELIVEIELDRNGSDEFELEVWNPDTGQRDALPHPGDDADYRFGSDGAVELVVQTFGPRVNLSGTLSKTGDVYTLTDGTEVTTPARRDNFRHDIARDVPVVLLVSNDNGNSRVHDSLVALWDPTTGRYDEFRTVSTGALIGGEGEPVLFTVAYLSPDGTLAVATYGNYRQRIVRFSRDSNSIYNAATVEDIVSSSDFDPTAHAEVLRLYQAIFGRYPDLAGAKYWIRVNRSLEDGTTYDVLSIAGFMSGSQEWAQAYGGVSDEQFVETVYTNVLGRDYDETGYRYWLDLVRGTNVFGGNPNLELLQRYEMVFYVTANTEFTNTYPFQP